MSKVEICKKEITNFGRKFSSIERDEIYTAMDIYAKEQVEERCKPLVEALEKIMKHLPYSYDEYKIASEALTQFRSQNKQNNELI